MEHGLADPLDAFAGATPYLKMFGLVAGGWVMARQALAGTRAQDGTSGQDRSFHEQKVRTARFYCEQLLPQTAGLVASVTATNRDLAESVF
jgi:3-(methylthio)propanoyl-CoA dehydrogenase